jgi:hypothetical protein
MRVLSTKRRVANARNPRWRPVTAPIFLNLAGARFEPLAKIRPDLSHATRDSSAPDPRVVGLEEHNEPLGARAPFGFVLSPPSRSVDHRYLRPGRPSSVNFDPPDTRTGRAHPPCTSRMPSDSLCVFHSIPPCANEELVSARCPVTQKCLVGILSALPGDCNNRASMNVQSGCQAGTIERNTPPNRFPPGFVRLE